MYFYILTRNENTGTFKAHAIAVGLAKMLDIIKAALEGSGRDPYLTAITDIPRK
jgi:hypothetical protein